MQNTGWLTTMKIKDYEAESVKIKVTHTNKLHSNWYTTLVILIAEVTFKIQGRALNLKS